MNLKIFIQSIIVLLVVCIFAPKTAFCELKGLSDDEMSAVDAKAGGLFDTKINKAAGNTKTAGSFSESKDLVDLNNDHAGFDALDGTAINDDFLSPVHQAPPRYFAPLPHCRSGGCR